MSAMVNALPNILITGTPGTGKTQTSLLAAEKIGYRHLNVSELVKEHRLYDGRDEEYDTYLLDEDKVCDYLEPLMQQGGNIVDFHSIDFFPERWFDLVLVLRADNAILFDRLVARGYNEKKRAENLECEMMQVVLEEAKESYKEEIVYELQSNSVEELESNCLKIVQWLERWKTENSC